VPLYPAASDPSSFPLYPHTQSQELRLSNEKHRLTIDRLKHTIQTLTTQQTSLTQQLQAAEQQRLREWEAQSAEVKALKAALKGLQFSRWSGPLRSLTFSILVLVLFSCSNSVTRKPFAPSERRPDRKLSRHHFGLCSPSPSPFCLCSITAHRHRCGHYPFGSGSTTTILSSLQRSLSPLPFSALSSCTCGQHLCCRCFERRQCCHHHSNGLKCAGSALEWHCRLLFGQTGASKRHRSSPLGLGLRCLCPNPSSCRQWVGGKHSSADGCRWLDPCALLCRLRCRCRHQPHQSQSPCAGAFERRGVSTSALPRSRHPLCAAHSARARQNRKGSSLLSSLLCRISAH
jgi:hypothetical protein